MPLLLRAANTHLYPGARLTSANGDALRLRRGSHVTVEFADLGVAHGQVIATHDGGWTLAMAAHRTARGADVPAHCWFVARTPAADDGHSIAPPAPGLRIKRRLPCP